MSNFRFLQKEWPEIWESAQKAEAAIGSDPRSACFYARRALELAVTWAFSADVALKKPYQDNLSALIHEPSFKTTAGEAIFGKARLILKLGNEAVHSQRAIQGSEATSAVRELFHVGYWLARSYSLGNKPPPGTSFDDKKIPVGPAVPRQTLEQLQKLKSSLNQRDQELAKSNAARADLDAELKKLREEVAQAKKEAAKQTDTHDYGEAQARRDILDVLLKEAGWPLDQARDREFEVSGMPSTSGKGFVDYVLWGDDGRPLALVEAKATTKSAELGKQQAKLYADCLEKQYGRRPVLFYSNGYESYLWDDQRYPSRKVRGFYSKEELELLLQRRSSRKSLIGAPIEMSIVERHYQRRAIQRIGEAFEASERKALVVMATGAGKTRTVIALVQQLMACNWAKRVLFLADRLALVKQAVGAFKTHLPEVAPVNLVTEKDSEGRVYVSTYPTMMGLIDEFRAGKKRFGPGYFDLIIIDEAHRSVYQKYGEIFQYFDALLVGLTATPKDEIDVNTYKIFDLERGVPTDAYTLEEAVGDGFLVPAKAVSVPLKFQREGIRYDQLSEEEKEQWDELEWEEEEGTPEHVDAEAVNTWLFNSDTVDRVLEHLMTHGQKVAGGDRLGKTIVFAKNQKHAEFIAGRFDHHYPHYKGAFARVIHCKLPYAQSLIDDFSMVEKEPHIALSVDMLDTGVDVPEVVNLVFFKLVRSKTKFWQMVGRGTRLCKNLFGPGQDKAFFYIFDFCQNLEYFKANPEATEGSLGVSLGTRIFRGRLELIGALDRAVIGTGAGGEEPDYGGEVHTDRQLRQAAAGLLQQEVAAMNLDNFVVRPRRRLVERFREVVAWGRPTVEELGALAQEVAGLPTELESDGEEAKRFDLLLLNLQLARLRAEVGYARLRKQVVEIAGLLEEKVSIPMVKEQILLIQDLQTESWWEDVTLPMLERVRCRLRGLIKLIDKVKRKPIYTSFEDEVGTPVEVALTPVVAGATFERFRAKARAYLRAHERHLTIHKLRMNRPLTKTDLEELERMLMEEGGGTTETLARAKAENQGLGLFVRSLVGLDREAAKQAFGLFLARKSFTANQTHFVNMIIDHLTECGVMDAAALYDSPFTDRIPEGPNALFSEGEVGELVEILAGVRQAALAA